jgi:hypothetical protein
MYITMAKSNLLPTKPSKSKVKRAQKDTLTQLPKDGVLDEDDVFKTFFTKNVENVIAIVNPPLHAAVDWSVPPEFLEQELINFLRGRLRQVDKRKVADKLLKLKLLSGKDIFVFLHHEIQNALTDDLSQRWFKSRMLISLRYNVEEITTIILFTGDAPKRKHSLYDYSCFGTRTTFKTNAFVIVKQSAKQLIAMNNPAALAFLAAKYAVQSKGDMKKRLKLKKKVFDLAKEKGFSSEVLEEVLTFVFDYMILPQKMEDEFLLEVPFFQQLKSDKKMMTRGANIIANAMCWNETGMSFSDYADVRTAEVQAAREAANEAKEAANEAKEAANEAKEAANEAKEAAKEAAKIRDIQTIHALLEDGFPIERIARILKIDVSYAIELAKIEV